MIFCACNLLTIFSQDPYDDRATDAPLESDQDSTILEPGDVTALDALLDTIDDDYTFPFEGFLLPIISNGKKFLKMGVFVSFPTFSRIKICGHHTCKEQSWYVEYNEAHFYEFSVIGTVVLPDTLRYSKIYAENFGIVTSYVCGINEEDPIEYVITWNEQMKDKPEGKDTSTVYMQELLFSMVPEETHKKFLKCFPA